MKIATAGETPGKTSETTEATMTARRRLVLADPILEEGLQLLRETPGLEVDDRTGADRETLAGALRGAAALIVRSRTRVTAELMDSADVLEVIGRAGVGVDNIDMEAATRRGIAVLNAPGGNARSTAELAFALMLASSRQLPAADRSVREGRWERKAMRGRQLYGKTLGVIGAGRIGAEVVRRARAFGMRVIACDPYLTNERAGDLGLERVNLDELLPRSDVITLHVPLTDATRGMLGRDEIAAMKEGAILINAARGGLVDETALAEALESGHLAAAGLDVFVEEPLPADSPLRDAPNLVFTPHVGAATFEAQREVSREIAAAVRDALLTGDLRAALNAPYVATRDLAASGPVLDLGRRLGILLDALTQGRCERLDVQYAGPVEGVMGVLAAAALEGFMRSSVGERLNLVNAASLAAERGIDVARVRISELADYTNYVELRAFLNGDRTIVGGALLGEAHHPRIVRVSDFHVDTIPEHVLVLIHNRDVPGVIGEVGTILGQAGVNIAEYHLSRRAAGAEALGLIRIDEELPASVIEELRGLSAVEAVRQVAFPD